MGYCATSCSTREVLATSCDLNSCPIFLLCLCTLPTCCARPRPQRQDLNSGKEALHDIIVLHLESGNDHFVEFSGDYARSCFGCTLEELVCSTEPIRNVPIAASPDGHRHFASTQNRATLSQARWPKPLLFLLPNKNKAVWVSFERCNCWIRSGHPS